jgi:ornithine--oxo-acid transaminase
MINVNSLTQAFIEKEETFNAHNYHPLPVVIESAKGVKMLDVEGKEYYDFLSAYSAVNQGHCHPRLVNVMIDQLQRLTLTSRAFHNNLLGDFAQYITNYFGYDKVLPMNTGVEAVETALKLCRRWAYQVKGLADNSAKIIVCEGNFHGRTTGVISFSSDPDSYSGFGPYMPNYIKVPYGNIDALKEALNDKHVAGFLVEPIQGEAGVVVPPSTYLSAAYEACKAANVLFIADEVQTGLARTGKMLCVDHFGIRPDIIVLGKALSGGMMPVSAVLADDEIMLLIKPGEHGSTFGGNPLACAVAKEALAILKDEELVSNAHVMGELFRDEIKSWRHPLIKEIRGLGLLNAIEINAVNEQSGWDICMLMMQEGVLAKPTHGDKIRFAPPLTITREEMNSALKCIHKGFDTYWEANH